jgi:hypothetical protein
MAVDALGGRMHDDVGAVLQRLLQDRGGGGGIDCEQTAGRVGAFRRMGDVD